MEKTIIRQKPPHTDSLEELAKFWDTHDLTDFEEDLEEVAEPIFVRTKGTSLSIDLQPAEAQHLKKIARSKGVRETSVVRQWILERLHQSVGTGRPPDQALPRAAQKTMKARTTENIRLIEDFKNRGQVARLWQWRARQFVCAANILRGQCEDQDLFAPGVPGGNSLWKPRDAIRLLYGLALENLLKGLLVAQGIDATSTGRLNKDLKTHNLVSLWKRACLTMREDRETALNNLHWAIEVGKYPVGTSPDPNHPTPGWVALTSEHVIADLLETAEDALHQREPRTFEKTDMLALCQKTRASSNEGMQPNRPKTGPRVMPESLKRQEGS